MGNQFAEALPKLSTVKKVIVMDGIDASAADAPEALDLEVPETPRESSTRTGRSCCVHWRCRAPTSSITRHDRVLALEVMG